MKTPPAGVDDTDVLAAVRRAWAPDVAAVTHLPVGFGAHHWRADTSGGPRLFVTLDTYGARHDEASLTAAYAGAAALAEAGLDFVHAGLEPYVVPLAGGGLSATAWLDGVRPDALDVDATRAMLDLLHAATPPAPLPRWRPLVPVSFGDDLRLRLGRAWSEGPHGETARDAIAAHAPGGRGLDGSTTTASPSRRPGARGSPPTANPSPTTSSRTADGLRLVDWESLKLAPAERDLAGLGVGHPAMLRMFDLEWRLDEVSQYATWFEGAHGDSDDDREALSGLLDELTRPDR